jgi:hypothetical protein
MDINKCAQLSLDLKGFETEKATSGDTLGALFNLQKDIQTNVYGVNFEEVQKTLGSVKDFIDFNEEAIRDEDREMANALGGERYGSAIWKRWKAKHLEARATPFDSLTHEELLELQYEWIDKLHFLLNEAIAIKLTPELIFAMYFAKNRENIDRQKRGY